MPPGRWIVGGTMVVGRIIAFAVALFAAPLLVTPANADPVRGDAKISTDGGYARLVIKLDEEVEATIAESNSVLVITFKKPVAVAVGKISASAPDYISAARQDPDGSSIRIALARKVKVDTIPASEWLFVDLLPENWVGLAPGLPHEVIDELARRTREAERQLRRQQLAGKLRAQSVVRVKVGVQPTFIRYIFDLPDVANVVPERSPGKLTLTFDQPLKFDLADAKATMPKSLDGIDADADRDSSTVTFRFRGKPLLRSFREEHSVVVDVGVNGTNASEDSFIDPARGDTARAEQAPAPMPPETVPATANVDPPKNDTVPLAAATKPPEPAVAPPQAAAAPKQPEPAKEAEQKQPAPQTPAALPAKTTAAEPSVPPAPPPKKAEMAPSPSPATARAAAQAPSAPPIPADMMSAKKDAPAPQAQVEQAAKAPPRLPADPNSPLAIAVHRQGANLRLDFPFAAATPAAVFRRGRMMWLVFDTEARIDTAALSDDKMIRKVSLDRSGDGATIMRLALDQPKLASFFSDGSAWVLIIGDAVVEPTRPVAIARSIVGKDRSSITIPFADPRSLHRISDPDIGDALLVVTALGPARGFLKSQDFVELRALSSTHGIIVQPLADDITAELAADKIVISRPGGLSLSSASLSTRDNNNSATFQPLMFDAQTWGFDRQANFVERQSDLMNRAAAAPEAKRRAARLDLARFYLARDMAPEAKGVLDVTTADEREGEGSTGTVLKAVADVMLGRPGDALKALASPTVGDGSDAPIWRAMAYAAQGHWPKAREQFKNVEAAIGALPVELQRRAKLEALRSCVEVRDFASASAMLNDFETLGAPYDMAPALQILTGRLEEGLGHNTDALNAYRLAAASRDRRFATQGRLREIELRFKLGDLKRSDVVSELEDLTTVWRGDETEAEGLQLLAHLYTQDKRYRDAFHVMRTALLAHPNSDLTRKIQDEAAITFDSLFLSDEGDAMPAIEALGLFYDYRELTPIGRRGDDMIRRLVERLVSVDLLDQAAELLQHQVDHRLQGAARAQVATRLATIYLMNRKPDLALAAIQKTRMSDIAGDLRDQRLLLESRAMSDIGRHDLALEVIERMNGPEALRLRADILWAAKKWQPAGEAIELLYGDRWKDFAPLSDQERSDVLRAAIAYALAEEPLGLARFRDKYAAKMSDGPDRHAFEVVTAPIGSTSSEFRAVAGAVANINTLNAFLAEMRKRFPDQPEGTAEQQAAAPQASAPQTQPAQVQMPGADQQVGKADDKAEGKKPEAAKAALPDKPPAGTPLKPDKTPTGSIGRKTVR